MSRVCYVYFKFDAATTQDQLYDIFRALPPDVQVCASLETREPEFLELISRFVRNAVTIRMTREALTLEGTRQFYVDVDREESKVDTLCDLFEALPTRQVIVYCNTRRKVDFLMRHTLTDRLAQHGYTIFMVHAEVPQREREAALQGFRSAVFGVLICTDLLAKGIDTPRAEMVINFDFPTTREIYLHRLGRRDRTQGVAINLVTQETIPALNDVEAFFGVLVEELPMNVADLL